jgi:hypothetical protein
MGPLILRPGAEVAPGLSPESRRARLAARAVMIATPIARNPAWQYTRSFASTLMTLSECGVRVGFQFVVGHSNVARARNELVAHFLVSEFTDLLFVDDDMEWAPQAAIDLLSSDKPLIGVAGRMRCESPNSNPAVWCCRWLPDSRDGLRQDEMGALEVAGVGAAFLLINRSVFTAMIAAHPEWKRSGAADWPAEIRAHYHEFFRFDHADENREVGEDYVFCDRWRALGGQVFVRPDIALGHVGAFTYRGAVEEILEAAPEAAA